MAFSRGRDLGKRFKQYLRRLDSRGESWPKVPVGGLSLLYDFDPSLGSVGTIKSVVPDSNSTNLTVSRNGTATYFDKDGLLKTAAANEPRFEFDPVTGEFKGVLVEPAATNLLLRSEEFDISPWSKVSATITTGSTSQFTSPDGNLNALLLTGTSNTITSNLNQQISFSSGPATLSIFAKAGNYNIFRIGNISSLVRAAWFDLNTGSVIGTVNGGTASIQDFGNGWFRCIFTATSAEGGNPAFFLGISSAANSLVNVDGANIYIWGAQLEVGSTATSYIPTVSSTVTRPAESIAKTNAQDLIGQTEGSIYVETIVGQDQNVIARVLFAITFDTSTNILGIGLRDRTIQLVIRNGSTIVSSLLGSQYPLNTRLKICAVYTATEVKCFANGILISSSIKGSGYPTSFNAYTLTGDSVFFGPNPGTRKSTAIFKHALTDEEAIALTTL